MTQVVWFKRDLRIIDHSPLVEAIKNGKVLPLYIIEPALWQQPDMSGRQYHFLLECLESLRESLVSIGGDLVIKVGDVVSVLNEINQKMGNFTLWSHQETWNDFTYQRDRSVQKWMRQKGLVWHEKTQNGVVRGLKNRDGWAKNWQKRMSCSIIDFPSSFISVNSVSDKIPPIAMLGLDEDSCISPQKGGRSSALSHLETFLYKRGQGYTKEISSPVTAFSSCSRLSPYLAFGCLSMKEVMHAVSKRSNELKALPRAEKGTWSSAMRSFSGRLRWHCHFIQKLEDEPDLEFKNLHPAYDALRLDINESYLHAWQEGKTGFPMIDACMRALIRTGWINFRMRAMLMSFASYHLWLPWQKTAPYLARLFIDYEPGIHYSQAQMQSGTTGINSIRIYNPIKQGKDHDPNGTFIHEWIPELKTLAAPYCHEPWGLLANTVNYLTPIVDESSARRSAASKIYKIRGTVTHKHVSETIFQKHGSRKKNRLSYQKPVKKTDYQKQLELPL